jgi:hypothetical protein
MSGIDANYVGPFIQSTQQSADVARVRDAEANRADATSRETARINDTRDNTVETADEGADIDNEAEGKGSQGRPFSEPPSAAAGDIPSRGITIDDSGQAHLDMEA